MTQSNQMTEKYLNYILASKPQGLAVINGSEQYPAINGLLKLYKLDGGSLVVTEVFGLPQEHNKPFEVFAFHIHSGGRCTGNSNDPFADALDHFNPTNAKHPYHAGDLPPLFSNYGYAFSCFVTARFKPDDVIGKTIIIHDSIDDFTTQPSGTAGQKIACGVISPLKNND